MPHWKVRFVRRGMEPPRPFGKTSVVVCAATRDEAKAQVPASPSYPCTASKTTEPVSFTYRCTCTHFCKQCNAQRPHHQCRTGQDGCLHCDVCSEMLQPGSRDAGVTSPPSIGIPYVPARFEDGRAFKICPICQTKVWLIVRKDFESYTGIEFALHMEREHPQP